MFNSGLGGAIGVWYFQMYLFILSYFVINLFIFLFILYLVIYLFIYIYLFIFIIYFYLSISFHFDMPTIKSLAWYHVACYLIIFRL